MHKITNVSVDETIFDSCYYIKINIMSKEGEYSEPLTYKYLNFFKKYKNIDLCNIINQNNGYHYPKCNNSSIPIDDLSICFNKKENAQNVVNKLTSILIFNEMKEE